MKKFIITSILAALVTAGTSIMAQNYPDEYLGLPGDNLNLYAVMNLFQESQTLEDFERNLNDANSRINNLDLNGDNLVDYITVNDYIDGNVHNIVLRVALNQNETQDVAVFTVQRFNDGTVQIQLVGDEALYGRDYIVEPIYDNNYAGTYNPGYTGRGRISINVVADWPLIRFIYYPGYISWHSSWYWGYYPSYWDPWQPYYWHYYYGYHYNNYRDYYRHYRRWHRNRYERYNDFYFSRIRSHSPIFDHRMREGYYRDTYSHPEMRREGEEFYSRIHSGRNSGRPDNYGRNDQGRRSVSQPNREYASSGPGNGSSRRPNDSPSVSNRSVSRPESSMRSDASRRSAPSVSNRSVSRLESSMRSDASRRSAPSVSNRSVSRPESSMRSDASRRSAPSVPSRSVSRPESSMRSDASQRSAPSASNRSFSRPESGQRRESAGPSRQSAPSARSSSQGSSRNTRTESASKRNDNSKESGSPQSSRRR
jgi:hypothetical protein